MSTPCNKTLPIICTQSAPVSNSTSNDMSTRYQVTQKVGAQSLTGYRDLFSWKFLGVRFALQPERFRYSTLYDGTGNASALNHGRKCIQAAGNSKPQDPGSEDCLFLNIYTPSLPSNTGPSPGNAPKAVLIWIYGGGFATGSNGDPGTDGTNLASRGDVVVVTLNHRLGNLGFLALDDGVTNGNYGLQDIITALRWVQKYISAFGGDPKRVTIFGQSSGAAAVRAMLASPMATGLFTGAIMSSSPGGFSFNGPYANYSTISNEARRVGKAVLAETGCSNATSQVECLRSYDAVSLGAVAAVAK